MEVHIGSTLSKLLHARRISTRQFAELLQINERNARAMLKKKYLHAATLVKISEVLQHDVIRYLYLPENLPGNPALKQQVKELEKENGELKKELQYLKEINSMLKNKK